MSSNIIRAAGGTVSWTGDSLFRNATFPSIGIVDLQNCKLTDEVYAALAKIPDDFVLVIDSNIFDQHTMRKLAEIEYLSGLFLEPGPVAERAVKDFQKQRPDIMVTVGLNSESGYREYPRWPHVTAENYARIEVGMSMAGIERMLGKPEFDTTEYGVIGEDGAYVTNRSLGDQERHDMGYRKYRRLQWTSTEITIIVVVDSNGLVATHYSFEEQSSGHALFPWFAGGDR